MNLSPPDIANIDSPPGPLQNTLKATELTDWRTIDWAAVAATTPLQGADVSNEGVSWTIARAIGFDDDFGDVMNDSGCGYGGSRLMRSCPVLLL